MARLTVGLSLPLVAVVAMAGAAADRGALSDPIGLDPTATLARATLGPKALPNVQPCGTFLGSTGDFYSQTVAVSGSYAYIADRSSVFHVIDISDPSAPDEVETLRVFGYSLEVVDVLDPYHSLEVGSYAPTQRAQGVAAERELAYLVGQDDHGIAIVDLRGCVLLFADGFESGSTSSWSGSVP